MIDWHRLFGLALTDLFANSPYEVELEKDLSLRQQFLDVVILRKTGGQWTGVLPDGLDDLAEHNLITYKSLNEPLDAWALQELIGHYVNYRKQISGKTLLPELNFKLYGIATRFPSKLAKQVHMENLQSGVYQVIWGTDKISIIVLNEIAQAEHNAMWLLFSGVTNLVDWGAVHYKTHTSDMSTIINQLFNGYRLEGIKVSYTMQDFRLDVARENLHLLSPEELLRALSSEAILRWLTPEAILRWLSPEAILQGLPPAERLRGLRPEVILNCLSVEDIADLKLLLQEPPEPID